MVTEIRYIKFTLKITEFSGKSEVDSDVTKGSGFIGDNFNLGPYTDIGLLGFIRFTLMFVTSVIKNLGKKKDLVSHVQLHQRIPKQRSTNTKSQKRALIPLSFACRHCGERFEKEEERLNHEKIHQYNPKNSPIMPGPKSAFTPYSYVCNVCHQEFREKKDLVSHVQLHQHIPKQRSTNTKSQKRALIPPCCHCNERFEKISELLSHAIIHRNNPESSSTIKPGHKRAFTPLPFACHYCDERFEKEWGLLSHESHHRQHLEKLPTIPGHKHAFITFPCRHCEQEFKKQWELVNHEETHIYPFGNLSTIPGKKLAFIPRDDNNNETYWDECYSSLAELFKNLKIADD
ncbi:hypothetical protein CEXT_654311 [Caerostris extrusa]|uniref:C2H2-type domain-containing protein n=1 Tax=Caerostris extrusa TaxID=172846 RepID=A0AAV4VIV5_CAEEX|nr:hypothetical protein CEXT_654311 [Caerostris extrusa]